MFGVRRTEFQVVINIMVQFFRSSQLFIGTGLQFYWYNSVFLSWALPKYFILVLIWLLKCYNAFLLKLFLSDLVSIVRVLKGTGLFLGRLWKAQSPMNKKPVFKDSLTVKFEKEVCLTFFIFIAVDFIVPLFSYLENTIIICFHTQNN